MVTTFERMVTIMKMQNAELEFVAFDAQDVIATSGDPKSVTFANFGNGNNSDNTMTFANGTIYTYAQIDSQNEIVKSLQEYFGTTGIIGSKRLDGTSIQLLDLSDACMNNAFDGSSVSKANGTWTWLNNQLTKVKQ